MARVAVVGAGVIGLSTAINIQNLLPNASVRIIADKFTSETTSYGAGGLFRPNAEHILGVPPDKIRQWSSDTFRFYSSLVTSPECCKTGHQIMSGYVFSKTKIENPLYKSLVFSFRELTPEEIKKLNVNYAYGYLVTTVITDCSIYLHWLMDRFKSNGGVIEKRTVRSLEEFVGQYDAVVNCSGFRSRDLVGDMSVYPVRGHLIRVEAPWIKQFMYTDDLAYFVPGLSSVALGGLRQKGRFDTTVDPVDTEAILQRCYNVWPSLRGAKILSEWVDLRPHRDPVRLEQETMRFSKGNLNVIHNYGHGANGITLSWGTAVEASQLVQRSLTQSRL